MERFAASPYNDCMAHDAIDIPQDRLAEICRRYGVKRLSLFGSVLTDRFGPESDVDMVVEFLPDARIGLFEMYDMEQELMRLVGGGRKVDLRTPAELSRYFRDQVMRDAVLQYAA
jgi:predicted nucleotidyltransferase